MRNSIELKDELLKILESEQGIPEEINKYELALEALENINSIDPVLRDDLILGYLCHVIAGQEITDDETREILKLALSDKHLFDNIGAILDDSVFNRSFTVLIIGCILYRHNRNGNKLFTREEILHIYQELVRYTKEEKDVRGYDEVKGWAHSAAHTSDALKDLSMCIQINKTELLELLYVIKDKLLINYYTYVNLEDERMLNAVMAILDRKLINNGEVIKWIESFEDIELVGTHPIDQRIKANRKNFLLAMYFRLKRRNADEEIMKTLESVIENITPEYFK